MADGRLPSPLTLLDAAIVARLEQLGDRLCLVAEERAVLAALVGVAISPEVGRAAQALQLEPAGAGMRVHVLSRWLGGDGNVSVGLVRALAADGVLVAWNLIERVDLVPIPLAYDRYVATRAAVAFALGFATPSSEVVRAGGALVADSDGAPISLGDAMAISAAVANGVSIRVIARDQRETALAVAAHLTANGRPVLIVPETGVIVAGVRDALLCEAVLVAIVPPRVEDAPSGAEEILRFALARAKRVGVPIVFVCTTVSTAVGLAEIDRIVAIPGPDDRRLLWEDALARHSLPITGAAAEEIADAFGVTHAVIERAAIRLAATPRDATTSLTPYEVGLALATDLPEEAAALGDFERIDPALDWASLYVPDETIEELDQLYDRCRYRRHVFHDMGLGRLASARGAVALFYGPPGTGKSMAAKLIAKRLGWQLLRIDASRLVSKWIGETEKNLRRVLDAAEDGRFALLFDEADALFGKRSTENRGGTDRYANMEINYLLQRLDHFDGIAFLTSNLEQAVDEAFRRRLAARIEFPMPEERTRVAIWRSMLPPTLRIADVELARIARVELSGGGIRNAVLRAAFLAAGQHRTMTGTDVTDALGHELRAQGKLAIETRRHSTLG